MDLKLKCFIHPGSGLLPVAYVELFSFQAMHANLLEKKDHTMLNMSYTLAHKRLKRYVSDL